MTLNDNHADDSPNINRTAHRATRNNRDEKKIIYLHIVSEGTERKMIASECKTHVDVERKKCMVNKRNVEKEIPFTFIMDRSTTVL